MPFRFTPTLLLLTATACYQLPAWKGEVNVTPRTRDSVATCGTGTLTADGAKFLSRHPYLQSTTATSTVVAFGATADGGEVVLRNPRADAIVSRARAVYAGDADRREARLKAQYQPGQEPSADDIYVMKAELSGLEPGHLYCYQLLRDGKPMTEPAPLMTAPPADSTEPVHFVAVGDTGTGGAAQLALTKRISTQPFDFLLFLGDIAYMSGTASQLENKFFTVYRDFLRYVPAWPSLGNHERRTRSGRPYFEAFILPEPERYYSFDWGPMHIVAIDTTRRDDAQLDWLEQDLSRNRRPWVIVFGHHPLYSNSLRGPQEWLREAFGDILTRHQVSLVLSGHEHQYERFLFGNVHYIVSGGGGGQLTRFFGRSQALKQATVHHFLAFEVTRDQLVMKVIDIEGKTIDTLRLGQPVPRASSAAARTQQPSR